MPKPPPVAWEVAEIIARSGADVAGLSFGRERLLACDTRIFMPS